MISYSENLQTKDHILNSSGYQKKSYTYVDAYVYLRLWNLNCIILCLVAVLPSNLQKQEKEYW